MEKITISIGLITKNEEKCLEKCLQSLLPILKNIPSELVIADTGSSDLTKDIAKKYTDKVFDFVWCDDFAKARNYVLGHCSGEWFMQIDADESFENVESIVEFFRSGECNHYNDASYIVRNYHTFTGESYTDFYLSRMFRRKPGRLYQGSIHEAVPQIGPVKYFDEFVRHYGYINTFSDETNKRKSRRNIPLLLKELEKNPHDTRLLYQAVQEYTGLDELKKAEEYCEKIIYSKEIKKGDLFVTYAANKLIEIEIAKGNFPKAAKIGGYYAELKMADMPEKLNILDKMSSIFATLDEEKKADQYYKEYFSLRDTFQKRISNGENGIVSRAEAFKADVYENKLYQYISFLQKHEKYNQSLEYLYKTKGSLGKKGINEVVGFWIKALEETDKMSAMNEYYIKAQNSDSKHQRMAREVLMGIWERRPDIGEQIARYFKENMIDECVLVQKAFLMDRTKAVGLIEELEQLCKTIQIEPYYQRLIYIAIENGVNVDTYIGRGTDTEIQQLAEIIYQKNSELRDYLLKEECEYSMENTSLRLVCFYIKLEELLLFDVNLTYQQLDRTFQNYIKHSFFILEKTYQPALLNPTYCNILPDHVSFIIFCKAAIDQREVGDWKNYFYNLKEAIKYNPILSEKIKFLIKEFKQKLDEQKKAQTEAKKEFDEYGKRVKIAILNLIKTGQLKEAKEIIQAYEKINPLDCEINALKIKLKKFT